MICLNLNQSKSTVFSMTCLSGSQRNHIFSEHNSNEDWYYQPKGVALKYVNYSWTNQQRAVCSCKMGSITSVPLSKIKAGCASLFIK